jgi:small-conductance mechanosensitive channel
MVLGFPISAGQLYSDLTIVAYRTIVFLAILAIGWVAGKVIGFLVGKLVSKAGGDSLLRQTVIGRALMRSDYSSFKLGQAISKWLIYLSAFLVALDSLSLPILSSSVSSFLDYLPQLVGSLLILLVGIILSDWMGEFVKKSASPEKRELFYLNVVGNIVKVILYFVTITLVLSHLGVDVTILYIVAQAFAWAIAIFVGIAAGIAVGWVLKDKVREWLP